MNRKHALTISLVIGIAAIAGTVAATRTIHLGRPAARPAPAASATLAKRGKALDRIEVSLRQALKQKPPKLPPRPAAVPGGARGVAGGAPEGQRVVYVRPAPIIRHVRRAGGESEHESSHDSEHGGGDGGGSGGGFDD